MTRVFVTQRIPEAGVTLLQDAGYEVVVSEKDGILTPEELLSAVQAQEYDAILSTLCDNITPEVLAAAPNVRIVANYAVGYDNIDLAAAKERDITVTNTPGVLTDAVAEHTFALLLALARRIPESDRFTRAGKYHGWMPTLLLGVELKGKKLGLIGCGRIGSRVAELAGAFGMEVLYNDIKRSEDFEQSTGAVFVETPDELLAQADFVSLHVPLLDATRHLVNAERLARMQPGAFLINTSRGPVIDEVALVKALKENAIRGAALDVFENEPDLTPGLAELENVILTPHVASATEEARDAMSTMAAQSIIDFVNGKRPEHVVER